MIKAQGYHPVLFYGAFSATCTAALGLSIVKYTPKILLLHRFIFLLLSLLITECLSAQVMPRAGTEFSFGIIEAADALLDPTPGSGTSILSLSITSAYDGEGIATSPNGFCLRFSFKADSVTTLPIPYDLMHLRDVGKTNKGILIRTTQPAGVVFHNFLANAGEATQIYPDAALETDYRITSWGLFNDQGEDNHSQFVITAIRDSTDVIVVPSVNALGNHPKGIPINVMLNRGECYIVKADITAAPAATSLSNSTVLSTKPVSIIEGVSCGYNPLGYEACDELIDQVLPRKYKDTIYYVVPLRDTLVTNTVLFTSDGPDFFVIPANGALTASVGGRAQVNISRAEHFIITEPVQCFLLSQGADVQVEGDPSIVTILPVGQYATEMQWYSPPFNGFILSQPSLFRNYISVVYPKAIEPQVLLDGVPLTRTASPQIMGSTAMAGAVAVVGPGVHRLSAPQPIFATVSGFADFDGYSFLPGTIGSKLPLDTIPIELGIYNTDAKTCGSFDASITSKFLKARNVSSADLNITYDPTVLTLQGVNLGPAAQGGNWITDTRVPGIIKISASCMKQFDDSGAIAVLTFSTSTFPTATLLRASLLEGGGIESYGTLAGSASKIVDILSIRDTMKATFTVDGSTAHLGGVDTAILRMVNIPNQAIDWFDLLVSYDHDVMSLIYADLGNSLIAGFSKINPIPVNPSTDKISITLGGAQNFTQAGILARLIFSTYVSDTTSSPVTIQTIIGNSRPCPLDILADETTGQFIGTDICGSQTLRRFIQEQPFVINSIIPNPAKGSFTINLDRHLFGEPLRISLMDMLGNEVWSTYYSSPDIHQIVGCTLDSGIPAGTYFVRVVGSGRTETKKIVIQN